MISLTMRSARTANCLRHSVPFSTSRHEYKYIYSASFHSIASRASSHSPSKDARIIKHSDTPENSSINAPATFPEPISVPERDPDKSLPKYLLAVGKTYLGFYKAGAKKIWHNRKTMSEIQRKLAPKYGTSYSKIVSKVDTADITRSQFQLLHRTRLDIRKLPIFGLIFLVCGEFTPLVAGFVTGILPFTCRLPKQIESGRQKLETRRRISFRNLTEIPAVGKRDVQELGRMQLLHISWSLGLYSSVWDWLGGQLPGLPTPLLRHRVSETTKYLDLDDKLIARYGGVKKMDLRELEVACVERGLDIVGKRENQLRDQLKLWIDMTTKAKIQPTTLLLTRPSVWPKPKHSSGSSK